MAVRLSALAGFRRRTAFDKNSVKTIAMLRQIFSKSAQFRIALSNSNPGLYDSSEALGGRMKGVVLAGGTGSRLDPLTRVTNKHLLPVYDKPMIYYPIQTLVNAGIHEILLVTGGKNAGDFLRLLGNGREFGLKHLDYTYQEGEGGIAQALSLAEYFADGEPICVVLGDNIIENNICRAVQRFREQGDGAKILLKEVPDAQRFGVPELRDGQVIGIEEKPVAPKSPYAVIGIYLYDQTVFEKIRRLKPSARGELEITHVNNFYIEERKLTYEVLEGWWTDAGTFASLLRANHLVAETGANKMPAKDRAQIATPRSATP
jgi:glucose-1-phosphate thymidylyltransferase